MSTPILSAATTPATRCRECAGRPCERVATVDGGTPDALGQAHREARRCGEGAHVHYVSRGDVFAVVVPQQRVGASC